MAARFFKAEVPGDAVSVVLAEAKARRFTSVEMGDAAIFCFGSAHAFRPGDAMLSVGEVPKTDDEIVALAEQVEQELNALPATDREAIFGGALLQLLMPLLMALLQRLLGNIGNAQPA